MAKHLVVTGAAGFIGSHLCEALLARGHAVTGVDCLTDYYDVRIKRDNLAQFASHERFRFVEESLSAVALDALLEGAGAVFHLAAQAGVRRSWGDEFEHYLEHNIRATQRLCEALRRHAGTKLVYASSSSVYGQTALLPMREDHPVHPRSPYGVTKLAGESLCLLYGANHGVPVVCLRYFTVYGPRQRPDMAFHKFIRAALDGAPSEVYGSGTQTRDFTYVDDAVAANLAAMDYDGAGTVFNIGGGSRVSLNHVIDVIGQVTGRTVDARYREEQKGDVMHTFADISAADAELGYRPAVALEAGLAREVEWVDAVYRRLARQGAR
ncbi:MAG TPA: NAD-dependent epimerase/dehydratase family protein [Candidatus Krumholzibacteria bacterium]|nr:NAD-dependent epimerase/dehydratase family protein [Candidatus Krumholzibacteria bacterium]